MNFPIKEYLSQTGDDVLKLCDYVSHFVVDFMPVITPCLSQNQKEHGENVFEKAKKVVEEICRDTKAGFAGYYNFINFFIVPHTKD